MKRAILFLAMVLLPMLAQAGDFEITLERKKDHEGQAKGGIEQAATQKWVGELKITNRSFKPTPELQVHYMLFVKRQELAQKAGADQLEKIKGSAKVVALKPGETATILTSEVQLRHQKLAGGFYYINGGASKADDNVSGVWVKLFNGTAVACEYINPPNLVVKNKWEQ